MKRAVLITGLIRDPKNFMSILDELENARHHHGYFPIVFSSWFGEVDAYPEVAERLDLLHVTVIQQESPNLKLTGHMLHQVIALEAGLSLFADDCFVLKMRPDLSRAPDIKHYFDVSNVGDKDGSSESWRDYQQFSAPVYVNAIHASEPFYINDITFAGLRRDLARLCTLPFLSLVKFTRVAPEQLLWSAPFFHRGCLFETLWRANVGLIFHDRERSMRLHHVLQESAIWIDSLAEAYKFYATNFRFLSDSFGQQSVRSDTSHLPLEQLLWANVDLPGLIFSDATCSNTLMSRSCMEIVLSTKYANSRFGDSFRNSLQSGGQVCRRASITGIRSVESDVAALGRRIELEVGIGGMRYLRLERGDTRLLVGGLPPAWTFITGTESRSLDPEVNVLKRTIDDLNQQISQIKRRFDF
jgi:hypothetical protein